MKGSKPSEIMLNEFVLAASLKGLRRERLFFKAVNDILGQYVLTKSDWESADPQSCSFWHGQTGKILTGTEEAFRLAGRFKSRASIPRPRAPSTAGGKSPGEHPMTGIRGSILLEGKAHKVSVVASFLKSLRLVLNHYCTGSEDWVEWLEASAAERQMWLDEVKRLLDYLHFDIASFDAYRPKPSGLKDLAGKLIQTWKGLNGLVSKPSPPKAAWKPVPTAKQPPPKAAPAVSPGAHPKPASRPGSSTASNEAAAASHRGAAPASKAASSATVHDQHAPIWNDVTLVNLVSAQSIPSLIPVLDSRLGVRRVLLLVSSRMGKQADWLRTVYERRGVASDIWSKEVPSADVPGMESICREIVDACRGKGTLVLNATGGTKLMAIAAATVFKEEGCEAIYVDTHQSAIHFFHSRNRQALILLPCLTIQDYLEGYGFMTSEVCGTWKKGKKPPPRIPFSSALTGHDLEAYTFGEACRAGVDEVAWGVKVKHKDNELENEFDCLILHQNRLFVIECKGGGEANQMEIVYKVNTVKEKIGGIMAQGAILGRCGPVGGAGNRAKAYGLKFLVARTGNQLLEDIRSWVQTP